MVTLDGRAVTWQLMDDEVVAHDLARGEHFVVNAAGSALWPLLAAGADEDRLAAELARAHGLTADRAAADVAAFVAVLRERGLVHVSA